MKIRLFVILIAVFALNTFFKPDPRQQVPDTAQVCARYKERVDEAYRLFQELKYNPERKEAFVEKLVALRKSVKFTERLPVFLITTPSTNYSLPTSTRLSTSSASRPT